MADESGRGSSSSGGTPERGGPSQYFSYSSKEAAFAQLDKIIAAGPDIPGVEFNVSSILGGRVFFLNTFKKSVHRSSIQLKEKRVTKLQQ